MLANTAILFLQEHWLTEDQLGLLSDVDNNLFTHASPGFIVLVF